MCAALWPPNTIGRHARSVSAGMSMKARFSWRVVDSPSIGYVGDVAYLPESE